MLVGFIALGLGYKALWLEILATYGRPVNPAPIKRGWGNCPNPPVVAIDCFGTRICPSGLELGVLVTIRDNLFISKRVRLP